MTIILIILLSVFTVIIMVLTYFILKNRDVNHQYTAVITSHKMIKELNNKIDYLEELLKKLKIDMNNKIKIINDKYNLISKNIKKGKNGS